MPNPKRARQKAARRQKLEIQRKIVKRNQLLKRVAIAVIAAAIVFGSVLAFANTGTTSANPNSTTTTTGAIATTTTTQSSAFARAQAAANTAAVRAGCPQNTGTRVNTLSWTAAPKLTISKSGSYYAHMVTTAGTIVIKLNAAKAPITVNNFVFLANHGFFNCVIFHRVIPGFVIQGGDPTGTGTGGPGYTIPDELPPVATPNYPLYSVAMANTASPNTGSSQFFIITGSSGEQLANTYSLFGQVVSGFSVVRQINTDGSLSGVPPNVTHRMLKVTISSKA